MALSKPLFSVSTPVRLDPDRSPVAKEYSEDAQERKEQNDNEGDEAIAGDALFVTHRAKALDAAGGQITDEPGICSRRAFEMIADTTNERRQIIFADSKFVEVLRCVDPLGLRFEGIQIDLFENRFLHGPRR